MRVVSSVPTTSHGAYLPGPNFTRWMVAAWFTWPFGSVSPTVTRASPPLIVCAATLLIWLKPRYPCVKASAVWSALRCQGWCPPEA